MLPTLAHAKTSDLSNLLPLYTVIFLDELVARGVPAADFDDIEAAFIGSGLLGFGCLCLMA